ncbi:hypothetical protein [Streptomyces sp. NPDC012746]|uniref:hypothetical protein n=1 Tax=Streptomyces sp. NPDC012746 TaxID=3364845 RepID=UPI00367F7707
MSHDAAPEVGAPSPEQTFTIRVSHMADLFWWHIDALLEVADVTIPEIEKLDSPEETYSTVIKLMSTLNGDAVKTISKAFRKFTSVEDVDPEGLGSFMPTIWEEVKSEAWGPGFILQLHEAFQRPPRLPIFLQSTTVSAVSNFEVLFSGLMTQYYSITPQALEAASREKEKEFSLRELKEMDSLADAIDIAIGRRVDELMFGSFSDWRKFCLDKLNLKFDDYAIDWEFLKEVFQRRHVIVHNGGLASRRYLRNVAPRFSAGVSEGDLLQIDRGYLVRAVNELLAFGFLLAAAVGMKLNKDGSSYVLGRLHKFTYRNLIKGRYEIVEKCSSYGESVSNGMDDVLTFRVNRWIAEQRLMKGSFRSEVEAWDVRALSPRYKLAKLCLLGENDSAMKLLASLYSAGEVGFEDVIEWPLLEPLRGTDAYITMTRGMDIPDGWHFSNVVLYENPKSGTLHRPKCSLVRPEFNRRMVAQIAPKAAALCGRCKPELVQ